MAMFDLEPVVMILACPACGATTNTSHQQCPSCATFIDPETAAGAAEAMSKLNQACSDASFVGVISGCIVGGALLGLYILYRFRSAASSGEGLLGGFAIWSIAVLIAMVGLLAAVVRWNLKFRSIRNTDPDFVKAKLTIRGSAAFAVVSIVVLGVLALALWPNAAR